MRNARHYILATLFCGALAWGSYINTGGGGGPSSVEWGDITGSDPQAAPSGGWTGQTLFPQGSSGTPAFSIANGVNPANFWVESDQLRMYLGGGGLQFLGGVNDQIRNRSGKFTLRGASELELTADANGHIFMPGLTLYTTGGFLLENNIAFGTDNTYCVGCDFGGGESGNRASKGIFGTKLVTQKMYINETRTPSSAGDTCTAHEIWSDGDYIYVCTATNTIKRAAIATWP